MKSEPTASVASSPPSSPSTADLATSSKLLLIFSKPSLVSSTGVAPAVSLVVPVLELGRVIISKKLEPLGSAEVGLGSAGMGGIGGIGGRGTGALRFSSGLGIFGTSGICSLVAVCGELLAGDDVDGDSEEGIGRGGCLLIPSRGDEGAEPVPRRARERDRARECMEP